MITSYAQGVTYSAPRVRFLLAMWCASRHRPFALVDDPEFRELLSMLYPRVEIPSRHTVSRDVQTIMEDSRARVLQHFKVCDSKYIHLPVRPLTAFKDLPGKVHICMDGWTSPNMFSFLGVTAHWHEGGEIRHIILDFIKYVVLFISVVLD